MNNSDELDLKELFTYFKTKTRVFLKVTLIFLIIGVFISFGLPVEYESYCKILPEKEESSPSNIGGLGGLAGLAGLNLDLSKNSFLNPSLFPEIVMSTPFQRNLLHEKITFQKIDTLASPYTYFTELKSKTYIEFIYDYTFGIVGLVKGLIKTDENVEKLQLQAEGDKILKISSKEWEILKLLSGRIEVSSDIKTGIITVQCNLPDPVASAQLTNNVVDKLKNEIRKYKLAKAEERLEFLSVRYEIAKSEYNDFQYKIAKFTDENRYSNQATSLIQLDQLKQEAAISYEVYKNLATQLEQAKINLKEQTPIFTIIEPVRIPTSKDRPKRMVVIFIFGFIGIITGIVINTYKFILK